MTDEQFYRGVLLAAMGLVLLLLFHFLSGRRWFLRMLVAEDDGPHIVLGRVLLFSLFCAASWFVIAWLGSRTLVIQGCKAPVSINKVQPQTGQE